MPSVTLQEIPIGSQLVSTIGANDPEDLNDFTVLLVFDGNITGLTEADLTLSAGTTLVSLEGEKFCLEGSGAPSYKCRDCHIHCQSKCGIGRECPNL